jgi:hypothetical protein
MTDTRAIIVVKKLNKFKIVKINTQPQNVFHISGKTSVDIIASLEKACQMRAINQKLSKFISH